MIEGILSMAQLVLCKYYRTKDHQELVNEILIMCRISLQMNNLTGEIIFDEKQENFKYIYKYGTTNN
jgi:hypothetical protein